MEGRRTTGPWTADMGRREVVIRGANSEPVASIWLNGDDDRANARLIAAGPEMLDALSAMLLEHDAGGITLATSREARAVIAKATGP